MNGSLKFQLAMNWEKKGGLVSLFSVSFVFFLVFLSVGSFGSSSEVVEEEMPDYGQYSLYKGDPRQKQFYDLFISVLVLVLLVVFVILMRKIPNDKNDRGMNLDSMEEDVRRRVIRVKRSRMKRRGKVLKRRKRG